MDRPCSASYRPISAMNQIHNRVSCSVTKALAGMRCASQAKGRSSSRATPRRSTNERGIAKAWNGGALSSQGRRRPPNSASVTTAQTLRRPSSRPTFAERSRRPGSHPGQLASQSTYARVSGVRRRRADWHAGRAPRTRRADFAPSSRVGLRGSACSTRMHGMRIEQAGLHDLPKTRRGLDQ